LVLCNDKQQQQTAAAAAVTDVATFCWLLYMNENLWDVNVIYVTERHMS